MEVSVWELLGVVFMGSVGDLKAPASKTTKNGFAQGIVARMMLRCNATFDIRLMSVLSLVGFDPLRAYDMYLIRTIMGARRLQPNSVSRFACQVRRLTHSRRRAKAVKTLALDDLGILTF